MTINYLTESKRIGEQYKKYRREIDNIFNFSENVSKDLTKYCLKVLRDESNPEIGRIVVESAFANQATMLTILKSIVKILYTVGHITKYKYGDYHALKKNIDEALKEITGVKAELAKKKYEILLSKVNKECKDKANPAEKNKHVEHIQDHINRQYINFVKKTK